MTQLTRTVSIEDTLRTRFHLATSIRERINVKREASKLKLWALMKELEAKGFVPTTEV